MKHADELAQENEALRPRLSRLSEVSLRINGSLRSRLSCDDGPSQAFVAGEPPYSVNRWPSPRSSSM